MEMKEPNSREAGDEVRSTFGQWQLIETAPKDGSEIIGFRPDQGVFVFRWSTMEKLVAHDLNGDTVEDYDEDQADWWHDRWGWMEYELRPTHWMPLPPPPKGGE
jgi:hypothetical protein